MNEQFTYRQVDEQHDPKRAPDVLVPRKGKVSRITVGRLEREGSPGVLRAVFRDDDGWKKKKFIHNEIAISDQLQAYLAEMLARDAGRSPEAWERTVTTEKVLGNAALGASGEQLKPESIERSLRELDRALGGELADALTNLPEDTATLRDMLDPNTGIGALRSYVEHVLRRGLDMVGEPSYDKESDLLRGDAAKLALTMLDGSFDGDPREKEYEDLPANHQAALKVLDYFAWQKELGRAR